MKDRLIAAGIPAAVAIAGLLCIGGLIYSDVRFGGVSERPLREGELAAGAVPVTQTAAGAGPIAPSATPNGAGPAAGPAQSFTQANVAVANLPGSWPCFRGENLDNVSTDKTPLAHAWGPQGPRPLWAVNLGEGYASPAVQAGRVYVLDYDQAAQADALRCFSLADGQEIWRRSYPVAVKRNHGMSRTVPAIKGNLVVTLGPKCHVLCCDALTGQVKWQHDLVKEYGATVPEWYAGQCPLIDGNRAIVAPSGSALMVAFDLATGKPAWQTPNPQQWQMTHSSIAPMTYKGRRMYVYCGSGGVAGVSAKDGALLWQTPDWRINTATVPTPLPLPDGRILLTGGYGAGAMMLQVTEQGAGLGVKTLYRLDPTVFGSDQQTPILYKGLVYGVVAGGQLVCLDPATGKRVWASGPTNRFGLGPYMIADGVIYLLDDAGALTMAEASPTGYKLLGQAKVLNGPDAWGPLALAGGRLLARDLNRMVCLDVAGR